MIIIHLSTIPSYIATKHIVGVSNSFIHTLKDFFATKMYHKIKRKMTNLIFYHGNETVCLGLYTNLRGKPSSLSRLYLVAVQRF